MALEFPDGFPFNRKHPAVKDHSMDTQYSQQDEQLDAAAKALHDAQALADHEVLADGDAAAEAKEVAEAHAPHSKADSDFEMVIEDIVGAPATILAASMVSPVE